MIPTWRQGAGRKSRAKRKEPGGRDCPAGNLRLSPGSIRSEREDAGPRSLPPDIAARILLEGSVQSRQVSLYYEVK